MNNQANNKESCNSATRPEIIMRIQRFFLSDRSQRFITFAGQAL